MRKQLVLLVALLFMATAIYSAEAYRPLPVTGDFNKPGGDLSEKDFAWKNFSNFFEQEHGYLMARLDQGYWLYLTIFTFKYGPQQRWGVYAIVIGDKGKQWFVKREIQLNEVKVSHDNISWESKGTSISGAYPRYVYTINEQGFKAKLTLDSRMPGWKLGRWYITPDKKNFGEVFIYVPWGRISGTLTLDGKQIQVSGNGYADRFHGSARFDRTDPLFYSVRALTPLPGSADVSIQTSLNHFNPYYGRVSAPSLMIMGSDSFIKASQKVMIKGEDFYKDPAIGYSFPRRIVVTDDEPGFNFRGVFKSDRNMEILNVMSQVPPYLRKIAETFFKVPVMSKWDGVFEGAYTLNGKETKFKIRAAAECNYIGGPEAQDK